MLGKRFLDFHRFTRYISSSSINRNEFRRIGIVGVPLSEGQSKLGVDIAPEEIRDAGLEATLRQISDNLKVVDYGDVCATSITNKFYKNMKKSERVLGFNKGLFEKIGEMLKENDQILTLGGDHSLAIGSVLGHLEYDPNIILIWVDAHADINLNITSGTGNMHGMPASFIIEELRNCSIHQPEIDWTKNRFGAATPLLRPLIKGSLLQINSNTIHGLGMVGTKIVSCIICDMLDREPVKYIKTKNFFSKCSCLCYCSSCCVIHKFTSSVI